MDIVFKTLLVIGLQASIIAIAIIAFRGIFKNVPKIFTYILWLMLLVRLVVPVIIETDYGITPSPNRILISSTSKSPLLPSDITGIMSSGNTTTIEDIDDTNWPETDVSNTNQAVDNSTNQNSGHSTVNKSEAVTNQEQTSVSDNDTNSNTHTEVAGNATTSATSGTDIKFWQQSWFMPAVYTTWSIGTVVVLLATGIQYISMKRKLQFAIRVKDNIWECETVKSPFVMGFIRPRIYLPINLPEDEREYILLHEQVHIKHLDHVTRLFMTIATAIHWWNPIVWLSMGLMKKDMEMFCDESATKAKAFNYRKAYSMTLLKYAAKNSGLSPVLCFGESNTERRVKHLMLLKKPKFYVSVAMILVMSFCLINCGAQRADINANNENNSDNTSLSSEEPVTLTVYSDTCSVEGTQAGWFGKILKEKFNVELNVLAANNDDDTNQYMGDYDIIMAGNSHGELFEAMDNGYLLDLSGYDIEKYMPYVSKHLTDSYIYDLSGDHHYGIRSRTYLYGDLYDGSIYSWDMRYDYYEELGKPEINNINDWANVLEQMKKAHNSTADGKTIYGISYFSENDLNTGMILGVQQLVNAYYGYTPNGAGFYDQASNTYYDTLAINADGSYGPYLEMLKLHNKLYNKGLIDPESETQDVNVLLEKYANGQVLTSLNRIGALNDANLYPVIPDEAKIVATWSTGYNKGIYIDSNTKYPELCMSIIDYLYSPEGTLTMYYGPKGECWDYDGDGYTYLTEVGMNCINNPRETMVSGEPFWNGTAMFNVTPMYFNATNIDNGESYHYEYWKNTIIEPANDVESSWRDWTGAGSVYQYLNDVDVDYTEIYIDPIDFSKTELNEKYNAVSSIIIKKSWEAIKASTEAEFNAIVQDMISNATAAGYSELVEYSENYINERLDAMK